jgi:hypothetical protein
MRRQLRLENSGQRNCQRSAYKRLQVWEGGRELRLYQRRKRLRSPETPARWVAVRAQTSSAASGAVRLHVKPQPPDGQRQSETEDVLFF